jgi:O-antigen ligase
VLNLWSRSFRYTKSKLLILLGSLFYSIICGSRTAIVTVIILSSFIVFLKMNSKKKIVLLSLSGIIIVVLLLVISRLFYIPTVSNKLFYSGTGELNTDLSGREMLIPIVFDDAIKYQPWGAGLGSGDLYINYITNWVGNTHNHFLAIFHDLGIIGFLLYLIAIISFITKTIKIKTISLAENSKYFYLLGVSFLIISLITSFFDSLWPYYHFLTNFIFMFAGFTLGMKQFSKVKESRV